MDKLPRMDRAKFRRARTLIRRSCANCDGGNCLLLDDGEPCVCPQLLTLTLICKYFRAAVLPADRELYTAVMENHTKRVCRICGAPVFSTSNAAKYCPKCALRERRRRDAERKRKRAGTSANRTSESPVP